MNKNQDPNLDTKTRDACQYEEIELLASIAKGNEKALEQLYLNYYSRLLRFIVRITGQIGRTDEVINEVMYVVWQKADTYNANCRPSTWIFGIAYNKARKSMHKTKFDQAESLEELNPESLQFGRNDINLEQIDTKNWLETAFKVLSLEQRSVIELSFFHGMHYREIAELMGCPENTVKTRMYNARIKLKPVLQRLKGID